MQQSAEMMVTYKYSGLIQQKNIQRNIILIGKLVVTIRSTISGQSKIPIFVIRLLILRIVSPMESSQLDAPFHVTFRFKLMLTIFC